MPYIKQEDRYKVSRLGNSNQRSAATAGELNFNFTELAVMYIRDKGLSYTNINDVIGAFEGAKLEFYRRVAAPYEDTKIKENGDVY